MGHLSIALPGEAGFEQRLRLEAEGVKFSGKRARMAEFEFVFAKRRAKNRKPPPVPERERKRSDENIS